MKILFVNVTSNWCHHLSTELELMKDHLEAGDDVTSLFCCGALEYGCIALNLGDPETCKKCLCRYRVGLKHINFPDEKRIALKPYPELELPIFDDIDELKNFSVQGVNLGWGALNSYIFYTRNYDDIFNKHMDVVRRFIHAGYVIMRNLKELFSQNSFDLVYIFNGRFAEDFAAVSVCKQYGIDYMLHERGSTKNKYYLVHNDMIHRLKRIHQEIDTLWNDNRDIEEKRQVAKHWFEERIQGKEDNQNWMSFTNGQDFGSLPDNFDTTKENIAIFNSSYDEYYLFDDYKNPIASENILIRLVVEHFQNDPSKHFYLRIHPNLKNVNNSQIQELKQLEEEQHKNLTIIWGESKIDSYQLVRACNKVITFGSTMGVESTYLGTPSILAGVAAYGKLNCCYIANNVSELFDLINRKLTPLDKENTLPYGYRCISFGVPFKYYQADSFSSGAFQGVNLDAIAVQLSYSI